MSKWDKEYLTLCKKILSEGIEVENRTGINSIKLDGYYLEFDLEDEFPFLTTKQLYYKNAILEMLWIYQAKSNGKNQVYCVFYRNLSKMGRFLFFL